ncbi:MAG: phosphoribosylamine--glycine ligase [Dethiosulfovibrio peptidovorans]|nr:MAG: phosphoribosylamine--glycine ligase [Dethiosulfovibrio peptidovorans]
MKVLILGGGGREHALAWACSKSPLCTEIHGMPGNPGIAHLGPCHPGDPCRYQAVLDVVRKNHIDLVIIGPEAPLVAGVADELRANGIGVFGPGRQGATLEGSKAYAKEFMSRHAIPTAPFQICHTIGEANAALSCRQPPYVVKADGLAGGKGVFILETISQAQEVCQDLLERHTLGEAGQRVVIEDGLIGREVSVMIITDGKTWKLMPPSQDHKRAFDGDRGPNTGGMGAYAPVPWVDQVMMDAIESTVVAPSIRGLAEDGIPYRGTLYAGLMISPDGKIDVLEYNVRLGDPETQALLPLFSKDWLAVCAACANSDLSSAHWGVHDRYSVAVVMASQGYPGDYKTEKTIRGMHEAEAQGVLTFHAGTAMNNGVLMTTGGRVLSVVGMGGSIRDARQMALNGASLVTFDGGWFRRDIAGNIAHPGDTTRKKEENSR